MPTVKLVARDCAVTGELGFMLRDLPSTDDAMSDVSGELIAHDVLEHVNGAREIGTIDDELEAMGAAWYVRGQHGRITRRPSYHSAHVNIAADVSRMGCEFLRGAHVAVAAIPRTVECDADADIDDILAIAERDTRAEMQSCGDDYDSERLALYMRAARARMRRGFRKAARKYRGRNVHGTFFRIADAVERAAGDLVNGAEYSLTFDYDGRASCEPVWEE